MLRADLCRGCSIYWVDSAYNGSVFFAMELNISADFTCKWQIHSFVANKYRFPSIILNVTNHNNGPWKTVRLTSFQKSQMQSVLISFNFVRLCLFWVFSVTYAFLMFCAVIFMFYLIWGSTQPKDCFLNYLVWYLFSLFCLKFLNFHWTQHLNFMNRGNNEFPYYWASTPD